MDYFFYGTLIDEDVLERVTERRFEPHQIEPAHIEGFRRVYVAGAWYPMLVPTSGERVAGCIVSGIDEAAAARIDWFEGDDFTARPMTVNGIRRGPAEALVYMAGPGVVPGNEAWDLRIWRRRHKNRYMEKTDVWMEMPPGEGG